MSRIDFLVFKISHKETHVRPSKHVILERTVLKDHPECVIFVKHTLSCGLDSKVMKKYEEELYFRNETERKAMFEDHCYLSAAN